MFLHRRSKTNHVQALVQAARREGRDLSYGEQVTLEDPPIGLEDIRYAAYPTPTIYKRHLEDTVLSCQSLRGCKQISARMGKSLAACDDDFVTFRSEGEIDFLHDFLSRAKASGYDTKWLAFSLETRSRLRRANICSVEELRSALRELLPHVTRRPDDDPVAKAERELIGLKISGFFPTPHPSSVE